MNRIYFLNNCLGLLNLFRTVFCNQRSLFRNNMTMDDIQTKLISIIETDLIKTETNNMYNFSLVENSKICEFNLNEQVWVKLIIEIRKKGN